ncbi:hypothetical protein DESC_610089 [Desulfosarcina cetonica]|nr:hypothetical protein DESC_610089 [Desulfosarcina cetonica]
MASNPDIAHPGIVFQTGLNSAAHLPVAGEVGPKSLVLGLPVRPETLVEVAAQPVEKQFPGRFTGRLGAQERFQQVVQVDEGLLGQIGDGPLADGGHEGFRIDRMGGEHHRGDAHGHGLVQERQAVHAHDVENGQIVAAGADLRRSAVVVAGRVHLGHVEDVDDGFQNVVFIVHGQDSFSGQNSLSGKMVGFGSHVLFLCLAVIGKFAPCNGTPPVTRMPWPRNSGAASA